jgi:hypothetical protein
LRSTAVRLLLNNQPGGSGSSFKPVYSAGLEHGFTQRR